MGRFDEGADLFVDRGSHLLGVVAHVPHVPTEEDLALLLAVADRTKSLRHAVLGHHRPRKTRGLLDVIGGARRRIMEDQLFGGAPTQHIGELVEHLAARRRVLLLVGKDHRVPERPPARHDRDLVHGIIARQRGSNQGVAAFVVRRDHLLFLIHDACALLWACDHAIDGLVERLVIDELATRAGGEERGLVQDVGEVRAGEPGRAPCHGSQIDTVGDGLAPRMDLEDGEAALEIRPIHRDLTVEPTGAQQGRVEDVRSVRRGDEDDTGRHVEPVHLDEHLVEGLLALIVTTAESGTPVTTHRVDLVDEDDRGRIGLGLLEEIAYAAGTHADEHLDEVRARDGEEGDARLASHGACEQRLAGAGWPVEEHALGDLRPDRLELRGLGEELLDLLEFLDCLVGTRDVGEGCLRHVLGDSLGLGLAEVHDPAAALHLAHEEEQQQDEECERKKSEEQAQEDVVLGNDDVVAPGQLAGNGLLLQQALEFDTLARDVLAGDDGAVLEGEFEDLVTIGDDRGLDLVRLDIGNGLARVDPLRSANTAHQA